jgi:hypothetical protein
MITSFAMRDREPLPETDLRFVWVNTYGLGFE